MVLPVPNLDDRRFQDLVDDAKRLVQQRCPEWTDHNVSDPGVTLIEAFAFMTDELIYRLNRVPDRNYVKFLELLGVRLFPPAAARLPLTFYLSAPQPNTVRIAAGTEAATVRTEKDEAIVFATLDDLSVVACSLAFVATSTDGEKALDRTETLAKRVPFDAFDKSPKPGNVLLLGLSDPVPSCVVSLSMRCTIEGIGVDPLRPPVAWEAWGGEDWIPCELESDGTGGFNRDGRIVLHVPPGHTASLLAERRAGWLRARVTEPDPDTPFYSASPSINGIAAATIGGTSPAVNARRVGADGGDDHGEVIGTSEGIPGQRFKVSHPPVVPGQEPATLQVSGDDGWTAWTQVSDFAASGPTDRHFVLDATDGAIHLGPAVRQPDGTIRHFGAVPPKGARLQLSAYLTGGGRKGNVASRTVNVLKTTIPFVSSVTNRRPGTGGVDGETIDNAKLRGPISLRALDRAVTADDYEHIVKDAAPEVARVRAVAASDSDDAGAVRVLVVPEADDVDGRLEFEQLVPGEQTLARIADRLDECRVICARVVVEPPAYRGITVVAKLRARRRVNPARLHEQATRALYRYFNPISGGPDATGWPFGRPVQIGEVYSVLQALPGTEVVEDVRLFGADPITGQRGTATQRLELDPDALVFSYEHQLMVEAP